MKVCLVTGEFPPMQGGLGDFTNELGRAVSKLKVEASVITSTKGRMQDTCLLHPVSLHYRTDGGECLSGMNGREFTNRVTNSQEDFLQDFLDLLEEREVPFCVIGGLAVNAYAEPVVSLDLDLVVPSDRVAELSEVLEQRFIVHRFPHRINVSSPLSDLRIQLQTDPKYQGFIARASRQMILGYETSVAALEDVLQGKVWAFSDPTRRRSKRQKDLADIMRLVETHPYLIALLPEPLRERIG